MPIHVSEPFKNQFKLLLVKQTLTLIKTSIIIMIIIINNANVYSAVITAKPLQEFTWFILINAD